MIFAWAAALAWAALDALRKHLTREVAVLPLAAWLNVGFAPLFAAWTILEGAAWPDSGYLGPWALAVGLNLAAQLLFLQALVWSGLGAVIPMLALTPAVSAALAAAWLGEVPDPRQAVGILLVVLGCLGNGLIGASGRLSLDRGALAMAGVAVLWSATGVVDKVALQHVAPSMHAAWLTCTNGLLLGAVVGLRGGPAALRVPWRVVPSLIAAVAALGLALGFQLLALQELLVGVVEALKRGVGMPLALLTGAWLFDETVPVSRWLAVIVIGVGVALVVLRP